MHEIGGRKTEDRMPKNRRPDAEGRKIRAEKQTDRETLVNAPSPKWQKTPARREFSGFFVDIRGDFL